LHDVGNLFVITQGQASAAAIGELYVDYDVVFETPQLEPSSLSASMIAETGVTNAIAFGTARTVNGCLDVSFSSNTITFNQSAQLLMSVGLTGTGLAVTSSSGGTVTPSFVSQGGPASTAYQIIYKLKVQPGDTVIFDFSGSTTLTRTEIQFGEFEFALAT
jgi:hypothetical protein